MGGVAVGAPDDAALLRRCVAALVLAGATACSGAMTAAGSALLSRWREPHRHYHDVVHLTEVLDGVETLTDFAGDDTAVPLAAWFHDAVYQGRPGADERASAALARRVLSDLGVPAGQVREVERLVRLTASHDPADDDGDGAVLCDADLAILAADPARYAQYVAGVRREYGHVPEDAFRAGRTAVLRSLADRPCLYRTPPAHRRWEARARANLARELAELGELGELGRPTS